jgi:adenine phosphoribosyltransferase
MNDSLEIQLLEQVRVVHDFPRQGIAFRDITTLLTNHPLSREVLNALAQAVVPGTEAIAGIESRGFLFGMALAMQLELPFVPIRKQGKLPGNTAYVNYELEYGHATIEMHTDALIPGARVHIHDDFLATGGSAKAAAELIRKCGGSVSGFSFIMGIEALNATDLLLKESPNIAILARC